MKYFPLYIIFVLSINCGTRNQSTEKSPIVSKSASETTIFKIDRCSILYAEQLISGKIKPSDNEETLCWVDSLSSQNQEKRHFAFKIYKSICLRLDGAISEAFSTGIFDHLTKFTFDFLEEYASVDIAIQNKISNDIAFNLYSSDIKSKRDVNAFFADLRGDCKNCKMHLLYNLEKNVIPLINKYNK